MSNLIQRTTEFAMHIVSAYVRPGDSVIDATCGTGRDTLRLLGMLGMLQGPAEAPGKDTSGSGHLYAFDIQEEAIRQTQALLAKAGAIPCSDSPDESTARPSDAAHFAPAGLPGVAARSGSPDGSTARPSDAAHSAPEETLGAAARGDSADGSTVRGSESENPAADGIAGAALCRDPSAVNVSQIYESTSVSPAVTLTCLDHGQMAAFFHRRGLTEGFASAVVFNLGYLPGGDKQITTTAASTLSAVRDSLRFLKKDGILCVTMYSGHPRGAEEKRALLAFAEELDGKRWHVSYIRMLNQKAAPPEILLISRKG